MQKLTLKGFKNFYCDAVKCSLGEFLNFDENFDDDFILANLTEKQLQVLSDYAVLKNKLAGVSELNLKVPTFGVGLNSLEKYGLMGSEVVSCKKIEQMLSKSLIGNKTMILLEDISSLNGNDLSYISDLLAKCDMPVIVKIGQNLEEVGKIVNKFNLSPVSLLEEYGFLDRKCFCLGLNFIDKDDQNLLKSYDAVCIFSPRSDAEEGKGFINLYNFIYNDLSFGFSSGICYNIDMFAEGKLAMQNTSNLMYDPNLVEQEKVLLSLQSTFGKNEIEVDENALRKTIFDKQIWQESQEEKQLKESVKQIANILKEKI